MESNARASEHLADLGRAATGRLLVSVSHLVSICVQSLFDDLGLLLDFVLFEYWKTQTVSHSVS